MLSYLNPFSDNFILKGVLNFLSNIISYINPFSDNFLGKKLVELIENVLKAIFIPDESNINNLIDSVKSKFTFIDTVNTNITSLKSFVNSLDGNKKITLNVSNKYFSSNVVCLDLSWFDNYKSYSDSIITAFVYLAYLWRLFIKVPSIIKGNGGKEETDDC